MVAVRLARWDGRREGSKAWWPTASRSLQLARNPECVQQTPNDAVPCGTTKPVSIRFLFISDLSLEESHSAINSQVVGRGAWGLGLMLGVSYTI